MLITNLHGVARTYGTRITSEPQPTTSMFTTLNHKYISPTMPFKISTLTMAAMNPTTNYRTLNFANLSQHLHRQEVRFQKINTTTNENHGHRRSKNSYYCKNEPKQQMHNFEIFGLDFMIDRSFKPWLIEINTNPCLDCSSSLLNRIIPYMIKNKASNCP